MDINLLDHVELDAWIARMEGYHVLSKAYFNPCPESGTLHVCRTQKFLPNETQIRYAYVDLEMAAFIEKQEGLEDSDKVLTYPWLAIYPVLSYSTDFNVAMPIIRREKISLIAGSKFWTAQKDNVFYEDTVEIVAAMKLYLALKMGL